MLPDDFSKHWIQNFIYETYFYGRLTKLYNTQYNGIYVNLYKYTRHRGKHIKEYYVKFNTMIQSYEIEYPRIGTIRYPDWPHTMAAMWNLEKMTNIEDTY